MSHPTRDDIVLKWCADHSCWFVERCWACVDVEVGGEIRELEDKIAKLEKDL